MSLFGAIENILTTKVWPFLKNIGKEVVQAEINVFEPLAVETVAEMTAAVAGAKSTAEMGQALSAIILKSTSNATDKAVIAGASAILAGVGTALSNNSGTANSLAVTTPAA